MKRVLHTYHEHSPELSDYYAADRLLEIWQEAWADAGWSTLVLTRAEAGRHAGWPEYSAAVRELPTVNPRSFETANYHRWMALAVAGGGFMSDTDVLPLGAWEPETADRLTIYSIDHLEDDRACPCFVHGTGAHYEAACEYFAGAAAWAGGWSHASDQELLRAGGLAIAVRREVLTYGDPRLGSQGRAVHFKNDAIRDEAGTKDERIARLYGPLAERSRRGRSRGGLRRP